MNTAEKLRAAIFLSIGCVAINVGCTEKSNDSADSTDTSTSNTGVGSGLDAIPAGEYPDCTPAESEFEGDCCIDVYCYTPSEGDCPEADNSSAMEITGEELGSGSCLCDDVQGPYSNEGAAASAETTGDCCYLVGVQGCEGRPMFVDEHLRKAPLVRGKRWSA